MKTPDMAKKNNALLRNAANTLQMGYYDHLANGGKNDPAQERWIEALTAGADAITKVAVLESRLAQVERERDAAVDALDEIRFCNCCKHYAKSGGEEPCFSCDKLRKTNYEWRGVCPENTKEE